MPNPQDYDLCTHDEAVSPAAIPTPHIRLSPRPLLVYRALTSQLLIAAKLIELGKTHIDTLTSVLPPAPDEDKKRRMAEEVLMFMAEDFDLSPDLICPGEGYRRGHSTKYKSSPFNSIFYDSLPRKKTKTSPSLDDIFEMTDKKDEKKDKGKGKESGSPSRSTNAGGSSQPSSQKPVVGA